MDYPDRCASPALKVISNVLPSTEFIGYHASEIQILLLSSSAFPNLQKGNISAETLAIAGMNY
jgi:hypothetical protein